MTTRDESELEKKLKEWINRIGENRRFDIAREWKREGKKVIGFISDYVPEEVIYAAGMLPYRIIGTWGADVSRATVYRPTNTDLYATHVLQSLLNGELNFLDGVIIPHLDDDQRRLWDLWIHLKKTPFVHYLYVPRKESEFSIVEFENGIGRLKEGLERLSGSEISDESLRDAIGVYNKWRGFLMNLYDLRKREIPPLSGSEFLGLIVSSFIMPKDEFIQDLEEIIVKIRVRKAPIPKLRPRILVSSEDLDNPAYLELIEECGCLVAMDDLNTGSRYIWQEVDQDLEPLHALAKRYLTRPGHPRMFDWQKYVDHIVHWIREFNIDGVINFPAMYAYWREIFTPYLQERLKEEGTPVMTFLREYHFSNLGQLRTRIEAFLEILGSK